TDRALRSRLEKQPTDLRRNSRDLRDGTLALIDAAAHVGGVGVPVPLNAQYQNDLVALKSKVNAKTRAIYLVNPHNPTGTINDDEAFKSFLRESSQSAVVVVDEAYLEYTSDLDTRS